MNKQELIAIYKSTMNKLGTALSSVKDEQFNEIPFEGSWTAAQVADHILKSQAGFDKILGWPNR